jgi:hypothetical protein
MIGKGGEAIINRLWKGEVEDAYRTLDQAKMKAVITARKELLDNLEPFIQVNRGPIRESFWNEMTGFMRKYYCIRKLKVYQDPTSV